MSAAGPARVMWPTTPGGGMYENKGVTIRPDSKLGLQGR